MGNAFLALFNAILDMQVHVKQSLQLYAEKNFGCSHFILGRDHTGVGKFYSKDDFTIVLSKLEDLGITPLIFDEYIYSQKRNNYINRNSLGKEKLNSISGTEARELFNNNQKPPSWYMRKEISSYIINALNSEKEVFVQ